METSRPSTAPTSTGRRRRRRAPTKEAVIAARIGAGLEALAEDQHGGVGDHRGPARAVAQRGRRVLERLVEHEPRAPHLAPGRAPGDELGQAGAVARAKPVEPLHVEREPGVEGLEPPLGAELEEGVGLEPGLLRGLPLAGTDRRLHAVERQVDEVVVGLVAALLPGGRVEGVEAGLGARGHALHLLGTRRRPRPPRRRADEGAQGLQVALNGRRPCRIAAVERRLEVGVGRGGAGAEGHGLLDLEVERDPRAVHPPVVLHGHEREEAHELLGAARRLRGGEGSGREPVERPRPLRSHGRTPRARPPPRPPPALRRRPGRRRPPRPRGPARSGPRGWASSPPPGRRPPPGAGRSRGRLPRRSRRRVPEPRLVGVEQVLDHGQARASGRKAAGGEPVDGEGGVGAWR